VPDGGKTGAGDFLPAQVKDTYEETARKSRTGTCRISTLRAIAFTPSFAPVAIGAFQLQVRHRRSPGDEVGARSHFGEFTARESLIPGVDLLEGRDRHRAAWRSVPNYRGSVSERWSRARRDTGYFQNASFLSVSKPKTALAGAPREHANFCHYAENKQLLCARRAEPLPRAPVILFDLDATPSRWSAASQSSGAGAANFRGPAEGTVRNTSRLEDSREMKPGRRSADRS